MSPNQLAAVNMRRLRKERSWKQDELAAKLGWAESVVSTAERSVSTTGRVRQFSIEDTVLIADVFGVPIDELLKPVPLCEQCGNKPPAGFTCNTCGRAGS